MFWVQLDYVTSTLKNCPYSTPDISMVLAFLNVQPSLCGYVRDFPIQRSLEAAESTELLLDGKVVSLHKVYVLSSTR